MQNRCGKQVFTKSNYFWEYLCESSYENEKDIQKAINI